MHPTLAAQTGQHLSVEQQQQLSGFLKAIDDTYTRYDTEHQATLDAMQAHLKEAVSRLDAAQSQLLHADKMASIGQLAAGVAHEINNPIGYVYSNLTSLNRYIDEMMHLLNKYEQLEINLNGAAGLDEIRQLKTGIDLNYLRQDLPALMSESQEGIARVKKIVQDLKDFSHVDEAEWIWTDLRHGLNSTLNIVHNEVKSKAEIVRQYGDIPEVQCIASQINQVFMNLLVNAGHAIETRGTITIATGRQGDEVWVKISDTGCGISKQNLSRIFDAFFTTKPVGQGTGLGLSLSYSIIQKHHGRIEVESEVGQGTSFTVYLPIAQAAVEPREMAQHRK
ncbi:MAG: ATPase [Burkholderiaceae bacterium]|nr:MAG: ATPase [Burkholderiaceae bacterium]